MADDLWDFWGHLFTGEEPSPALTRLLDAAFDQFTLTTGSRMSGSYPSKELTPGELKSLYKELGRPASSLLIPLDNLGEFYNKFKVPFVVREVADEENEEAKRAECLQENGWHRLIAVHFFRDPEQAHFDLEQIRAQYQLVDPTSNKPFPSIPRSAAPSSPIESYVTLWEDFSTTEETAVAEITGLVRSDSPAQEEEPTSLRQESLSTLLRHPTRSFTLGIPPSENPPPYDGPPAPDPTAHTWQDPILAAPETPEDSATWYGSLINEDAVTNVGIRFQIALCEANLNLFSDLPGPTAGFMTPWSDFLEDLITGQSFAQATLFVNDNKTLFDILKLPYEMIECTVPEDIKTAFPLLNDLFTYCEGTHACLKPTSFSRMDWVYYSHAFNSFNVTEHAIETINSKIRRYKLIDPIRDQYFPEIPVSIIKPEHLELYQDTLNIAQVAIQERIWGEDQPIIKLVDGKCEVSEVFRRFLRMTFDYLLEIAPPTTPATHLTALDFWFWLNQFSTKYYLKEIELVDAYSRMWAKWGIVIEYQEVKGGNRSYGEQFCLTFDNWVDILAHMGVAEPIDFGQFTRGMCSKWPLFDPVTGLRFSMPITVDMYPEQPSEDDPMRVQAAEALTEWGEAEPVMLPLWMSKEMKGFGAVEPEASATRLRNMILEKVEKKLADKKSWTLPMVDAKLITAFM